MSGACLGVDLGIVCIQGRTREGLGEDGKQWSPPGVEMGERYHLLVAPWKETYDKPRQCIRKQRHHFANEGVYSQSYGFSSTHIWM